jgi:hypothetical protein
VPNYSRNTHAPDQTSIRPRHLQCASDLTAPCQSDLNSERVFMSFRGPQALNDIYQGGRRCQAQIRDTIVPRMSAFRDSSPPCFLAMTG